MTIDLNAFNQAIQNHPTHKQIADLRAQGHLINHVFIDTETGDVLMSEDGAPFKPAHPFIKAMVAGTPYPRPGRSQPCRIVRCASQPARQLTRLRWCR